MSNIIKSTHFLNEKRLIEAKKIEFNQPLQLETYEVKQTPIVAEESGIAKRENLKSEISFLQQQLSHLKTELEDEKEKAHQEISSWWLSKQQELLNLEQQTYDEASKQGFEDGYQKGYDDSIEEFQSKINSANEVIQMSYEERDEILKSSEPFLLELSVKIAEKIIVSELEDNPEKFKKMISNALNEVDERGQISILVSSEDFKVVNTYKNELQLQLDSHSELKILPDYKISRGSCMINTPNGSYNVTLDNQLEEVKKHLLEYYFSKQE